MSIEGRIAIDVSFADSATSSGVQAIKKIQLVDTTAYTTGKVAIVTGTVGTAAVLLAISPTAYKDSSGSAVSFSSVSRIAFSAAGPLAVVCDAQESSLQVSSRDNRVAVTDLAYETADTPASELFDVYVKATAGTATYTLVMYGT